MTRFSIALFLTTFLLAGNVFAQRESDESTMIFDFKGLQFKAPDSSFYINFRFRMKTVLGHTQHLELI